MQPSSPAQQPVIRTYKGRERRAAEQAYRLDSRQAATAGWVPVAHRWTSSWEGHELAVVFEYRPATPATSPPTDARGTAVANGEAQAAGVIPTAGAISTAGSVSNGQGSTGIATMPVQQAPQAASPTVAPPPAMTPPARPVAPAPSAVALSAVAAVAPQAGPGPDGETVVVAHPPAPEEVSAARAHARTILQTIDLHCAGEPLRLVRTGYPQVPFAPILERRRWVTENADWARGALLYEPRGHRDMYGAVLLQPYRPDADIAVLFMHNAGYSTMCGHGIIALTTGLLEERLYPVTEPRTVIRYETPAGLVTATADVVTGRHGGPQVTRVRFVNVPAYRHATDLVLRPEGVPLEGEAAARGGVRVDVAFGGAYYGIVDAAELGLRVVPSQVEALTRAGAAITAVLRRDHAPMHPTDPDLGFIYGTIIVDGDPASSPDGRAATATLRTATVFADAEVDRSPCGSGTSALLAHLFAQGRIGIGRDIVTAGITGESFEARIEGETTLGDRRAVFTSVAGMGFVTGYHTFVVDERDPLGGGFLLR